MIVGSAGSPCTSWQQSIPVASVAVGTPPSSDAERPGGNAGGKCARDYRHGVSDLHDRRFAELDVGLFHDLLRLRVDVFVVEQACAYPELDGRDVEPGTRHVWIGGSNGDPVAYLRVLAEADGSHRIGRVATRTDRRGGGLAGRLVDHVVASTPGRLVLDAQSQLEDWYLAKGFVRTGDEFTEDGIPHVPMAWGD
jgi:ElaA protein